MQFSEGVSHIIATAPPLRVYRHLACRKLRVWFWPITNTFSKSDFGIKPIICRGASLEYEIGYDSVANELA